MGDSNVHKNLPRVNDLVMVEGSHSVASAGSDGSVHVWRVDLISSSSTNITDSKRNNRRVAGSTNIKRINPSEGEILAVNQFNNQGSSLITYATEKGSIHSWAARAIWTATRFIDAGHLVSAMCPLCRWGHRQLAAQVMALSSSRCSSQRVGNR